jgi:hypothetical protein
MLPNPEAAAAALELERYFDAGTYSHAAALSMDSAVVEPAQHTNLAETEDTGDVLAELDQPALAMETPLGSGPTIVETQRSA